MKILKISLALIFLLTGINGMYAQVASLHDGRGCMESRSCGFTMCIQPDSDSAAGEQCLLVQIFSNTSENLFISSDSGDYAEFDNSTQASFSICYDISVDIDVHEDGEILINCGILDDDDHPLCMDGCIVIVSDN